jgi:hypothetical protein
MSRAPASAVEPAQFSSEEADRIRLGLEHLLASAQFRGSRRCQLLLQYVTARVLAGDVGAFKERTIGVAVFGRVPDYDTSQDPIVRATAAEVRKKLAQYYQEPEHEGEIRIALLSGSYIPEFHFPVPAPPVPLPAPPPPVPLAVEQFPPQRPRRRFLLPLAVAIALCITAAASVLLGVHADRSPLDKFWGNMVNSPSVLICMGQPGAYNLRSDKKQEDLLQKMTHTSNESLAASREVLPLRDLAAMTDRYIAVGDALCLVHIASLLERRGGSYLIRTSGSTTFSDLREHPAILIGAFNNEWTLRFGAQLRYTFYEFYNLAGETQMIRDRDHPENATWKLINAWPDWKITADYALISRVRDRSTDRMLVVAAGITQFGTVAAGEFVSKPDYFAEAASRLPNDWASKNVQIVLQVPVVNGVSSHPKVLATYVW